MSNVNEPEGALKMAAAMVGDQIHVGRTLQKQMADMGEMLGRTVVLAEMLDEQGNGEVVLKDVGNGSETSVSEHLDLVRDMLLSLHEMNTAIDEQLGGAQMLYERFLEKYTEGDDDDAAS
jgi:hypothetical protein